MRQRRAILRALQDPDVLLLMDAARHEMPELNRHYDHMGLNVAIPQGIRKWVWIAKGKC